MSGRSSSVSYLSRRPGRIPACQECKRARVKCEKASIGEQCKRCVQKSIPCRPANRNAKSSRRGLSGVQAENSLRQERTVLMQAPEQAKFYLRRLSIDSIETPHELDIADPQNISNFRFESEDSFGPQALSIEDQASDTTTVRETAAESRTFVCTPFSLLVSVAIIGIGAPKAIASFRGEAVVANNLDWIIGVPVAFLTYWVGILKEQESLPELRWFLHDDFRDIRMPRLLAPRGETRRAISLMAV